MWFLFCSLQGRLFLVSHSLPRPAGEAVIVGAMEWGSQIDSLADGVRRVTILRGGKPASHGAVIEGWRRDGAFRGFFGALLAAAPFAAYFWETPPVTRATAGRPFECLLAESPALAGMRPDPAAFARQFEAAEAGGDDAGADVATFRNLGGDALLVAPCPRGPPGAYPHAYAHMYAHLAAFARAAPAERQQAFWRAVGAAAAERLGERPLWVSTSGLGVAWLHVRLDARPKYYTYEPYRRMG